jgi:hypothetical protein
MFVRRRETRRTRQAHGRSGGSNRQIGGDQLTVKTAGGEFFAPLTELYDAWWNSIARAMA